MAFSSIIVARLNGFDANQQIVLVSIGGPRKYPRYLRGSDRGVMENSSELLRSAFEHHQGGRLDRAEQLYRQILLVEPDQPDALHLLGVIAHQVGRHEKAVELIEQSVRVHGKESHVYNNLGAAYRALLRIPEAIASYRKALELKPDYFEAQINLAHALNEVGTPDEVVACYRRALELNEDSIEAHLNLGNALKSLGQLDEAVASYRRTIELSPNLALAHVNLGVVLKEQNRTDEAIACYREALNLNPDFAEAHNNLAIALGEQGNRTEAMACFRQALALKPDYADAHNNLGNLLSELGNLDEAIACFQRAISANPAFAKAMNNLGVVFKRQEKLTEATNCFRQALALNPHDAEIHNNLGAALKAQGMLDEAEACCRRALALSPNSADVHNHLGNVLKDQGKLDEAIDCYRRAVELDPNFVNAHSNLIYTRLFFPGYDANSIFEEHRQWNERHALPLASSNPSHGNERTATRRLRIGYVSPDFRHHVIGRNLIPLFREHDHQKFEIYCYSDVQNHDGLTKRFRGYADVWRESSSLTDQQLVDRIREDKIDILVDLAMHLAQNRLLAFARKPAPVQVTFAGYPGTTGLTAIDYRLTDRFLDPPGLFERCFSEQSIRLPNSFWCFDPLACELEVNALPAVQNGIVTFACLNNFCKVNAQALSMWARVLHAVDQSRLVILSGEGSHRRHTLDLLVREGIAPDRVTFVTNRPREQYLKYYHEIDIGLDTIPYNGHSTSLDSYWMGVPVVTLVGSTVAGRAGLCQLMNLGLPELIADTEDEFVSIASELARNLPKLQTYRATMRHRMEVSPLMDAPRFARNIEASFVEMWKRWCAEQASLSDANRQHPMASAA